MRSLTAADLGIRGDVQLLKGSFSIAGDQATVRIDIIQGVIENPFEVVKNLVSMARAEGASTLRIEGTVPNERLFELLVRRYGLRTEGQWILSLSHCSEE